MAIVRNIDAAPPSLGKVAAILGAFRTVDPNMTLALATAFVAVAQKPGGSVTDYCNVTGLKQPTMSRLLMELGERSRGTSGEGYRLIEQRRSLEDYRRTEFRLTPRGRELIKTLVAIASK